MSIFSRPYLALVALIGIIVPRRLRPDWRKEWEAELQHRERLLSEWHRLDRAARWHLLRRSVGAFRDALWLQRQRWEDDAVQDVRLAVRMLTKSPAFTLAVLLTLGLGIGANAAIYTAVNALLFRPIDGVPDPGRLVQIYRQYSDRPAPSDSTYPDYVDYRDQNATMSGVAVSSPAAFHVSTNSHTARVEGELVSGNYFDVLRVTPARGRLIAPSDDRAGTAEDVCVISDRLWQREFGSEPGVVGSTLKVDGRNFTIIGVATAEFAGIKIGTSRDLWVPLLTLRRSDPGVAMRFDQRRASWLEMFGRLRPGVTLEQARTDFSGIAEQLERGHPDTNAHTRARLEPGLGHDVDVRQQLQRFTYLPIVTGTLVLLIACANVAGLLLARAAARRREMATRIALGAGRVRVVRQLMTESLVLALVGGSVGLAIGMWLMGWLRTLLPDRYLFLSFDLNFGVDLRVFVFMLAIAAATGVLFGLAPAVPASRPDLVPALKASVCGDVRSGRIGSRSALVAGQVALSMVLLVAAGLCVRTLRNAAAIDTGYDVRHVLTARVDLAKQRYTEVQGRAFQHVVLQRLRAAPGVVAAALAVTLPLNDSRWENRIRRDTGGAGTQTFENIISTGYFDAMGIPLIAGRAFADRDDSLSPRVAVVNQKLAAVMWPGGNPVGRRFIFKGQTIEVIGVARDTRGRNLFEAAGPLLYLPLSQFYEAAVVLHVRSRQPEAHLAPLVRREVEALDRDLPVYSIGMLDEHVFATLTPQRLLANVSTAFGGLALLLSGVGLYGLLSYTVAQRKPEISIRLALGAGRQQVGRLFLVDGLRVAAVGIAVGVIAAGGATLLMTSLLFGVSPFDPTVVVAAAGLLALVSVVACALPALRASRSDPKSVLRAE